MIGRGGMWPDVAGCGAVFKPSQEVNVVWRGHLWRPVAISGPNHNPRVGGSSPSSATNKITWLRRYFEDLVTLRLSVGSEISLLKWTNLHSWSGMAATKPVCVPKPKKKERQARKTGSETQNADQSRMATAKLPSRPATALPKEIQRSDKVPKIPIYLGNIGTALLMAGNIL